jgi:hypothetical protein
MNFHHLKKWLLNQVEVKSRLQGVIFLYLLFLLVPVRKHCLQEAARFSGKQPSQFSRLLKNHSGLAVYNLNQLSKKQAKQLSKAMKYLDKDRLPWKIAVIIDSTFQNRATLHTDNAKKFNHGKGYVIGHQWTNIVLLINDIVIPLVPIAFHSKKYCRENGFTYKTENESVVEYITNLDLEDYIGNYNPKEVIVLADSGYDDKRIENAICEKKWKYIIALNKKRSVKSEKEYRNTPKSRGWNHVAELFRRHRRPGWQTVRLFTDGSKRKRMDFRIRQIVGYLRYVGKVQLICSEFKKNAGWPQEVLGLQ